MKTLVCAILSTLMLLAVACGDKEKKPSSADAAIAKGKALFEAKTCATCHGLDGKGDTPTGKAIKARNFQTDAFKQGEKIGQIAKTILNGVPGTGMVGFASTVSEKEAKQIAKFIRSLRK